MEHSSCLDPYPTLIVCLAFGRKKLEAEVPLFTKWPEWLAFDKWLVFARRPGVLCSLLGLSGLLLMYPEFKKKSLRPGGLCSPNTEWSGQGTGLCLAEAEWLLCAFRPSITSEVFF
ncbi:hypothetical protein Nepgr_033987 [Nepenthes gracilis]|uniref:Uncharacterized protein n=1 Tax=Nepenthes gracilis TaxID=150966 RepID=A0AAD3Y7C6_NEPGR|nr:hypothetical protein Nepgr_033987 [Nepenthes gracilis]